MPGTLAGQGIGDDITTNTVWTGGIVDKSWFTAPEMAKYREPGNVKVPFWLQPEKYYAGAAWYQRDLTISQDWQGKRVVLLLERPHWETRVWLDGQLIGTNNALATPHEYDLGQVAPGKHTLTIRVDNRMVVDVGRDSHSVSDHTQGNWNGIVGRIELRATPLVWIEDLQVYPLAAQRTFKIKAHIRNPSGLPGVGKIKLDLIELADPKADSAPRFRPLRLHLAGFWGAPDTVYGWEAPPEDVPGLELWNEFSPRVYQITRLLAERGFQDRHLRPSRHLHLRNAVHDQRPQDLHPRHAGLLHLPQDRPSADGRGRVEAHHRCGQGAWTELDSLSFVVSAGSGVPSGGRTGFLFPRRSFLLGELLRVARRWQAR